MNKCRACGDRAEGSGGFQFRTTTAAYKGKDVDKTGPSWEFNSSQRDGDSIRATAQLIDALSGKHVWADSYDREVTDLFAVKDEITLIGSDAFWVPGQEHFGGAVRVGRRLPGRKWPRWRAVGSCKHGACMTRSLKAILALDTVGYSPLEDGCRRAGCWRNFPAPWIVWPVPLKFSGEWPGVASRSESMSATS